MQPLNPDEPRQLGPYRLIAALGEGGMGRVLLGIAPDGRLVAVKQVHAQFAQDPGFRERFQREVTASRLVSGAYTAAVMDADPEAETPWLASVFVTGPSLREAVDEAGPLPADALRQLAIGLAAALSDIHRAGLIHRDLKPSNVLLTDDGPRVIDFGIARAVEEGQELTGTGAIIGSPAFMSPEQAGTAPVTPASDVFSLGALLVMAATGRGPFTGASTAQTLYNVVHSQPDLTALPPEVRLYVDPCLAKNPAYRPTPAQLLDFVGHLPPGAMPWPEAVHARIRQQDTEVRTALSLPLPEWKPPPKRRPAKKRRRWVLAAAAVVLLVASTVTVYRLTRPTTPPQEKQDPVVAAEPIDQFLTPQRLLRVDPCKVLAGSYLPERNPQETSRCQYTGVDNEMFDLILAEKLETEGIRPSSTVIEGQEVLLSNAGGTCKAMVRLPSRPDFSVMVYKAGGGVDLCPAAEDALAETLPRLRDPAVDRPSTPGTLLLVDPCAALDDATTQGILGEAVKPNPLGLRRCEWRGRESLTIHFREDTYTAEGDPADLGGGVTGSRTLTEATTCVLSWAHRPSVEDKSEIVILTYSGPADPCAKAREAGAAVVSAVPKS